MSGGPLPEYRALAQAGEITIEPVQSLMVENLQILHDRLQRYRPRPPGSDFFNLFRRRPQAPKGLYLHGNVGRGKTMLMDLFYRSCDFESRQRWHFHGFMQHVHASIANWRRAFNGDPIPMVADDIAEQGMLLCLDEFQVTDIADAMILGRLFTALFEAGVVVVATSNTVPSELYRDGLNRDLFLPFIDMLLEHMDLLHFDGERDYRLDRLHQADYYHSPLGPEADRRMQAVWRRLAGPCPTERRVLEVNGRALAVPKAARSAAWFSFAELCEAPLGAADYLAIARHFHAVFLAQVPVLARAQRNETRRLITLIDTLYDRQTCLIVSAAAEPDGLYPDGDDKEVFARTASRLMEMRSEDYGQNRNNPHFTHNC